MMEISQNDLLQEMETNTPPVVIDVRFKIEYNAAHIKNAVHIPFYSVFWKKKYLPADKTKSLVLTCEHGPRAVMARRLLRFIGYKNIRFLEGHMTKWKKNQLPTVS
jgi:rhodanese-related sulfurtransferase